MPFYWRKSKKIGPIRLSTTGKGWGVSIGNKLARIGKNSKGQTYFSSSPGLGLWYRKILRSKRK